MGAVGDAHPLRARDFVGILEDTEELVTVVDAEGNFQWLNHAARELFGVDSEEYVGRSAFDFIHGEDLDVTKAAFEAWTRDSGTRSFSFENRQLDGEGKIRHMLWNVTRRESESGEFLHFASTARDVTDLHKREERLARSEARMRALFRGTLDALVVIDSKGIIQDASESVHEVFGWRPEDLIGKNVSMLMPEPYASEHDGYLDRYRETGTTSILNSTREFPVRRRDGVAATCEVSISRVDIPREEPLFLGSFRDVTERRRVVEALRTSEARFRAVFEQEYQFVGVLRPDGVLLEVNQAALSIVDVPREDVIGKPFWEGPWFSHSSTERERVKAAVTKSAAGEVVREVLEIVTSEDLIRVVDFSLKPLIGEDGEVQLLIPEGRDITALKRAQERETGMLRSLAEIGESASILVHEIKNPITAINLALAAVAEKLGEDQRVIIEDLSLRMRKLEKTMRRTLSFAKPLKLERRDEDVALLLDGVYALLGQELKERGTKFVVEPCDESLVVCVDHGLVEELITNLVHNSMEALEGSGTVTMRARVEGDNVVLEVEDDGPGVPARQRDHLFEPFQTTKLGGTGLGLPLCRKVAEEHGGSIACVDRDGGGALFRVTLPRVKG